MRATDAAGLIGGVLFGFTLAWSQLTDPRVIRDMLLLKDPHVFLIMASAVLVAAAGVRLLKKVGARALVTNEPIAWTVERARVHHVTGSVLFACGWTVAGTCPGPLAAMLGQGRLIGLPVAAGLFAGVVLQRALVLRPSASSVAATPPVGL